ncbi:hypothetical protein L218DRAFT_958898 [Marasmius fiardii PR-910]|nr:hypothetical protein L218DRAFT_958898 [Marasmius fiardii PR-910]
MVFRSVILLLAASSLPLLAASKAIAIPNPIIANLKRADPAASVEGAAFRYTNDMQGQVAIKQSNITSNIVTFLCSESVTAASAQIFYYIAYPWELAHIDWTGGGTASCTIPMVSISFNLWAIGPDGRQNTIASGRCAGCTSLNAVNTGYECQQGLEDCDGSWKISVEVIFIAPPPNVFDSATGICVPSGSAAVCTETVDVGSAPRYNVVLPEGFEMPQLDARAIADIRANHYVRADGTVGDPSKGVFNSLIDDSDLETIFENGLKDSSPWGVATEPNYRIKTWPLAGMGTKSLNGPLSTGMALVIDAFGSVITMYPV